MCILSCEIQSEAQLSIRLHLYAQQQGTASTGRLYFLAIYLVCCSCLIVCVGKYTYRTTSSESKPFSNVYVLHIHWKLGVLFRLVGLTIYNIWGACSSQGRVEYTIPEKTVTSWYIIIMYVCVDVVLYSLALNLLLQHPPIPEACEAYLAKLLTECWQMEASVCNRKRFSL